MTGNFDNSVDHYKDSTFNKPDLTHVINIKLSQPRRGYAISLMKSFLDNQILSWDNQGNLHAPFSGLNIIDIINTLADKTRRFPPEQRPLIKTFLRMTNLPDYTIKNTIEKNKLIGGWLPY